MSEIFFLNLFEKKTSTQTKPKFNCVTLTFLYKPFNENSITIYWVNIRIILWNASYILCRRPNALRTEASALRSFYFLEWIAIMTGFRRY